MVDGDPERAQFQRGLRHTASSLLESQGVPPRVTMEILGHSTIATTMDVYTHVGDEAKRDAMAKLDARRHGQAGL